MKTLSKYLAIFLTCGCVVFAQNQRAGNITITDNTTTNNLTVSNNSTLGNVISGNLAGATGLPLSTGVTGTINVSHLPAFTGGNVTSSAGSGILILGNTAVTPGTYGNATNVFQAQVNAEGRIVSAANVPISATGIGNVVMTNNAASANRVTVSAGANRTIVDAPVTIDTGTGDIVTSGNVTGNSINVATVDTVTLNVTGSLVGNTSTTNNGTLLIGGSDHVFKSAQVTANNGITVVEGNHTLALSFVAPGTSGNVLSSNGTAWTSAAAGAGSGNVTNNATLTTGNIVLGGGTSVVGISNITTSGNSTVFPGNITVNSTVMAPAGTSLTLHSNTTNTNSSSMVLNSNGNTELNATDHYFYDTNRSSVWARISATGVGVSSDATTGNILYFSNNGTVTGTRQFQVNVHDANKRLDMTGNLTVPAAATVSGTNTGDQATSIAATAWVEVGGNNTSAAVGDILHPFATIDAALDALPSTDYIVRIGRGTFASPTSSKIHSHGSFIGSGRPVTDSTYSVSGFIALAISDPTMLVGGTILQGNFAVPYTVTHISVESLGVDCGSAFIGGGTAQDGLSIAQSGSHPDQTTTPPRPGMRVFNVATLCKAFDSSVHGCLLENCFEPTVKSLYTYNGFAGLVLKTINAHAEDIHANGHSLYGIILKSNDYAYMGIGTLSGFEVEPIGGHSCGGVFIDSTGGTTGDPVYGCVIENGTCFTTSYAVTISGQTTDSCTISNVIGAANSGTAFNIAGFSTKVTGCTARSSGSTGFYIAGGSFAGINVSDCTASANAGDGFQFDGSTRVDFDNLTSTLNTGWGINASGSAVYGGRYLVNGNTAGATTGTINAASQPLIPVTIGGTGVATVTANAVVIGQGTSAFTSVSPGTSGNVLTSNGTAWTSAAGGGGGSSDFLSTLTAAEISITTTATATISRMHVCSGTSANYTVTLPAVSGNTGKFIGFRMAHGLTKLVTLDGNGSETIDGALTRIMWADETAMLECDGTTWTKVAGKSVPMKARMYIGSNQSGLAASTLNKINFDTVSTDLPAGLANTGSSRIDIKRPASYTVIGQNQFLANGGGNEQLYIYVTGALASQVTNFPDAGSYPLNRCPDTVDVVAGDYIELKEEHFNGTSETAGLGNLATFLSIVEIPSW